MKDTHDADSFTKLMLHNMEPLREHLEDAALHGVGYMTVGFDPKDWKITQRVCNIEDVQKTAKVPMQNFHREQMKVTPEAMVDFMKRHIELALHYYELEDEASGRALAAYMRKELGYSTNSYWWDLVKWKGDFYHTARRQIFIDPLFGPIAERVYDILKRKGILTKTKGEGMHPDDRNAGRCADSTEKPMTIKRHKQITDLAYELKAVMDKKLPDLKGNELCMLGEIMQRIGNLK